MKSNVRDDLMSFLRDELSVSEAAIALALKKGRTGTKLSADGTLAIRIYYLVTTKPRVRLVRNGVGSTDAVTRLIPHLAIVLSSNVK